MPFTRPSQYPDFCTAGVRTIPSTPLVNTGYVDDQQPLPGDHNFLFGTTGDWIRWLDQQQQLNSAQFEFDATVGVGGTYATINSLVAAIVGGAPIHKVLVFGPQTLAATQVISSGVVDLELVFKPDAVYSKGLTTTPGLSIAGQRITVRGGRWTSFNGVSDKAIQLEASSKNCRVVDVNFIDNTTAINDLGSNNLLANNIEEIP